MSKVPPSSGWMILFLFWETYRNYQTMPGPSVSSFISVDQVSSTPLNDQGKQQRAQILLSQQACNKNREHHFTLHRSLGLKFNTDSMIQMQNILTKCIQSARKNFMPWSRGNGNTVTKLSVLYMAMGIGLYMRAGDVHESTIESTIMCMAMCKSKCILCKG